MGASRGSLAISTGPNDAGVIAELPADALSDLVQDVQSTMEDRIEAADNESDPARYQAGRGH